ncbi:hypothetical protein Q6A83_08395 [Aliarcobacter skirrowii]|uniref:hypothetical protein n=1 Tax=Aliarcobacter skirrowii TaxID=28200 RepID=UPI0029BA9FE5|nr:hypothetical protein [Aliarcobacter skirrowii]MDX4050788.1 hypothetical protein [Aliarcobacter skirrowii]
MKKITIVGLGNMGLNFINSVNKDFKKNISDIEINSLLLIPKELDKDFIINNIQKNHQIFVIAGLGGSTSNALIELVDILKEKDIAATYIALKPFVHEGKEKNDLANRTIDKFNELKNDLNVFDNNDLLKLCDENTKLTEAFILMDKNIFEFIIKKASM